MRRLLLLSLVAASGCRFDSAVPSGVELGCDSGRSSCPEGDVCSPVLGVCVFGGAVVSGEATLSPSRATHGTTVTAAVTLERPLRGVTLQARSAAGRWAFAPATLDGVRVTATWVVPADVPEGEVRVVLEGEDATGEGRRVLLAPSVSIDLTPPGLAFSEVRYVGVGSNPLVALARGDLLAAVSSSADVEVRYQATEASAQSELVATLLDAGPAPLRFDVVAEGLTTRARGTLAPDAGAVDAPVLLSVRLRDALGNVALASLGGTRIDTVAPAAPPVDAPDQVTLRRAVLEDGGSASSIEARGLEPRALLATRATGVVRGRFEADAEGAVAAQAIDALDAPPRISLQTIDEGGNASPWVEVRDVVVEVPAGSPLTRLSARPNVSDAVLPRFERDGGTARAGAVFSSTALRVPGNYGQSLTFDPTLGALVITGGWENGSEYDSVNPAVTWLREGTLIARPPLPGFLAAPLLAWDETRQRPCGLLPAGFGCLEPDGGVTSSASPPAPPFAAASIVAVASAGDAGVVVYDPLTRVAWLSSGSGLSASASPDFVRAAAHAPWADERWAIAGNQLFVRGPQRDAGAADGGWLPVAPARAGELLVADVDRQRLLGLAAGGLRDLTAERDMDLELRADVPLSQGAAQYHPLEHVTYLVSPDYSGTSAPLFVLDAWTARAQVVARLPLGPLKLAGVPVVGVRVRALAGASGTDPDGGVFDGLRAYVATPTGTEQDAPGTASAPLDRPQPFELRQGDGLTVLPVGDPLVVFFNALGRSGAGTSTLTVSEVAIDVHVRY